MMRRKVLLLLCVAGYTFEASKSTCNGETTPETILTGPLYQLGDYTGCLNRREQQYCLAQVQLKTANVSSPLWTNVEELSKLRTHFRRDLLYVGLCVPAQSTVTAVSKGLEDSLRDAAKKLGVSAEVQIDQRACQTNQQQQQQQHPYSAVDLMTGFGVLVVTLLVLSGTGYDAFTRLQEHIKPSETKCTGLLLCFSLIANSKKLYAISRSESHNEFPFIQGFRAVTVSIFVLPHVFLVVLTGPVRNPEWVEKSYVNICWTSLYNSSLYLGVFFCIGGFLLSYLFLREIDGKQAFRWSDFLMVLVHRYMRLTPVYAAMIVFGASWFIHMGESPMWNIVAGTEVERCRRHWWINLLYFNNYFEVEEMCLPQSWYLAADFQCQFVSMLLLILVWKYPWCAKAVLTGVPCVSIVISFVQTYIERLDPLVLLFPETMKHLIQNKTFRRAHVTFHHNFAAYSVGVIFGYVHYSIKHTGVKCIKMGHCVVWLTALTALVSIHLVSTVFYQPSYQHDMLIASLYACSYRIIVAAATGTILMACALGHGGIINHIASSGLFQLLGHLSYCVYLIHSYVIQVQIWVTKEPVELSWLWIVRSVVSAILVSYALAVLLHMLIEMPSAAVFKWILNSGLRSRREKGRRRQHND